MIKFYIISTLSLVIVLTLLVSQNTAVNSHKVSSLDSFQLINMAQAEGDDDEVDQTFEATCWDGSQCDKTICWAGKTDCTPVDCCPPKPPSDPQVT